MSSPPRRSSSSVSLFDRAPFLRPDLRTCTGRRARRHAGQGRVAAVTTLTERQARFDRFRNDFNDNRPHEALGQVSPTGRYRPSPRPYPSRIEEPRYDAEHGAPQRRDQMGRRFGLSRRCIAWRADRHRRNRARRLAGPLCRWRPRHHRSQDQKAAPLYGGPASLP